MSARFARNVSCVATISTSMPAAILNSNPRCSRGGSTESRRRWTATECHTCRARRPYRPSPLSRSGAIRHEIYLVAMTTSGWCIQRRTEPNVLRSFWRSIPSAVLQRPVWYARTETVKVTTGTVGLVYGRAMKCRPRPDLGSNVSN